MLNGTSDGLSPDRIAKALSYLDFNDRDVWWKSGAAIYSALGDAGKPIWEDWSKLWPRWDKRESDRQWKNLRGVTRIKIGSLFYNALMAGWRDEHYYALSDEEKAAQRERWQEEVAQAERELAAQRLEAKAKAARLWAGAQERGASADHDYIKAKGIRPYGAGQVRETLVLPLYTLDGEHVNNQMIKPDKAGSETMIKHFHTGGQVSGAFLPLTPLPEAPDKLVVCEGWATGCSIQEALPDWPVVVAWNAHNMAKVAAILHGKFPAAQLVLAGDRDASGVGQKAAERAAAACSGWVVLPCFDGLDVNGLDAPKGASDFNDLHKVAGLAEVGRQLLAAGPPLPLPPSLGAASPEDIAAKVGPGESGAATGDREQDMLTHMLANLYQVIGKTKVFDNQRKIAMSGAAAKATFGAKAMRAWQEHPDRKSIEPLAAEKLFREAERLADAVDELYMAMRDRYVHLDGTDEAWDGKLQKRVGSKALRAAMGSGYKLWLDDPMRRIIRAEHLVFDPKEKLGAGYINTYTGLPEMPVPPGATHDAIQDLLADLCGGDGAAFTFVERWLALQLQKPGTKLASALLFHSEHHGAGKGLFFEDVVIPMFGKYGNIVGQNELESSYMGWASEKLFILFEEISAPGDARRLQGRMKHMVTGRTQQIERKFLETKMEDNHANLVIHSNEENPQPLEQGDRRWLVVSPPHKLRPELKDAVLAELASGGVAAYRQYLLELDLDGFHSHTEPPMTTAKRRLIDRNIKDWQLFFDEWQNGDLGLPFVACRTIDLFSAYLEWAVMVNAGSRYSLKNFSGMISSRVLKLKKIYRTAAGNGQAHFFMATEHDCRSSTPEKDALGAWVTQFREAAAQAGYKVEQWRRV